MIARSIMTEQKTRMMICEKKLVVSGRGCQIAKSSTRVTRETAPRNTPMGGGQR